MKSSLAESPRFPAQRSSAQGESAPKERAKAVSDGKLVNIPVPMFNAMWGRSKLGHLAVGIASSSMKVGSIGKSVLLLLRCDDEGLRI